MPSLRGTITASNTQPPYAFFQVRRKGRGGGVQQFTLMPDSANAGSGVVNGSLFGGGLAASASITQGEVGILSSKSSTDAVTVSYVVSSNGADLSGVSVT